MEQFFQQLKNVRLSDKERLECRNNLIAFIKKHPAKNRAGVKIFASFITLLLTGASVSYAAEGALPGDILYPAKIYVNEQVVGALSLSQETKAKWAYRRVERRLGEAEKLASEGRLNSNTRSIVEKGLKSSADEVNARIIQFKDEGKQQSGAEISSEFETSLRAHEQILKTLNTRDNEQSKTEEIAPILLNIQSRAREATESRKETERAVSLSSENSAETAAESSLKSTKNKIEEIQQIIKNSKGRIGEKATKNAETRLQEARELTDNGKQKLDEKKFGGAFQQFQRSQRLIQETKLLLKAKEDLNMDVKFNIQDSKEDNDSENATSTPKLDLKRDKDERQKNDD
jgi:hypothetical protein